MIKSSELSSFVAANLITQEQANNIHIFQSNQIPSSSGWFSQSIVTIGAILVWLGILSLVALNRDGISDMLKIIIMLTTLTLSFCGGRYFKHLEKPLLWGSLLFLSGLICGCTIFLIAQIYNLTVTNDILLALWIVMILPLVYLLKQKEFYYLYMILLSSLLGQFLMSHVFVSVDERNISVLYTMFGFLMILSWYVHDFLYDDLFLARLYKIFGANLAMIPFFVFIAMSDGDGAYFGNGHFVFSSTLLFIVSVLLSSYLICYLRKRQSELLWSMIACVILLAPFALSGVIFINYALFIWLCLVLIYMGYQHANTGLVKAANIYLYLFLLYLYAKYGREYQDKALFFIVGGVLMIGLGVWFSKLNRILPNLLSPKWSLHD